MRSRGYTMMEVMMGLALLGVGALGIVNLMKTVLIGNTKSRQLVTADRIALTWAERLQTDAVQWNNPNGVPDLSSDTYWLGTGVANPMTWFIPATVTTNGFVGSSIADVDGVDIFPGDNSPPAYCTHLRMEQLSPTLIRVEIRVFWERANRTVNCAIQPTWDAARFGAVYVTTAIEQNTTQQ